MRSSVRGWRGWASNPCPSRTCSARCWTWSNQRAKVSVSADLLDTFSLYFLSCLDVAYRHWSALSPGKITLGDLKRCRMAHIFFDTFFNLEKYLDHEQRDPFAVQKVGPPPHYIDYLTGLQSKTIKRHNSTDPSSSVEVFL